MIHERQETNRASECAEMSRNARTTTESSLSGDLIQLLNVSTIYVVIACICIITSSLLVACFSKRYLSRTCPRTIKNQMSSFLFILRIASMNFVMNTYVCYLLPMTDAAPLES